MELKDIRFINLIREPEEDEIKFFTGIIDRFDLLKSIIAVAEDREIILGECQAYAFMREGIERVTVQVFRCPHKFRKLLKIMLNTYSWPNFKASKELFLSVYNPDLELSQTQYRCIFNRSAATMCRWFAEAQRKREVVKMR
jgi:hypothetical protein